MALGDTFQYMGAANAPFNTGRLSEAISKSKKPSTPGKKAGDIHKMLKDQVDKWLASEGYLGFVKKFNNPKIKIQLPNEQNLTYEAEDLRHKMGGEPLTPAQLPGPNPLTGQPVIPPVSTNPNGTVDASGGINVPKTSFWNRIQASPETRYKQGMLAQAIGGTNDPRLRQPLGARLGTYGASMAQGDALSSAISGGPISPILRPEDQLAVQNSRMQQKALEAQTSRDTQNEVHANVLDEQRKVEMARIVADMSKVEPLRAPVTRLLEDNNKVYYQSWDSSSGNWKTDSTKNQPSKPEKDTALNTSEWKEVNTTLSSLFYPYAQKIAGPEVQLPTQDQFGNVNSIAIRGTLAGATDLSELFDNLYSKAAKYAKEGKYTGQEISKMITESFRQTVASDPNKYGLNPVK